MELSDSSFEYDRVERYCMGAGVIPISTDESGRSRVLLGRERWIPQWRGSCRWSGFEGSRKSSEDVVTLAVREFLEESLGVVDVVPDCDVSHRFPILACRLRARLFWRRIVLKIEHDRRPERYHCTYVVPVPWDPIVPERFHALRLRVEQLDRVVQEFHYTRPKCLGDTVEHIGDIARHDDGSVTAYKLTSTSPCILRAPWSIVNGDVALVSVTFLPGPDASMLLAWADTRERLQRALLRHPCVRTTRDERWNRIQDVCIQRDFLEKDQVRWWTTDDLSAVIAGRGQLGPERFRPYFLPVLQTVLAQMGVRPVRASPPLRCEPVRPDSSTEEELCESPP